MYMRFTCLVVSLLFITPAYAQTSVEANSDRLDQLEQDMLLLKRQQERLRLSGNGSAPANEDSGGGNDIGNAQTNVRISALEQEIKILRGQLEEKGFETQKLADEMERFKKDTEFRLTEIEKTSAPAAATEVPAADTPVAPEKPDSATKASPAKKLDISVKTTPELPETPAAPAAGETPRDHYNYAFRLLNQNQYDDASKSFSDFVKKFPKDPLVGNAYYWQGETFYIRKDYAKAADHFRQGFESMPNGPKAGDNLLKLGMSLAALKKKEEACVVLSQVMSKYKTASANIAAKAQAEHKRIACE